MTVPSNCKGKSYIFHVTALSAVSSCREESHCLTLWPLNAPNCSPVGAPDVCEVSQWTWGGGGSFMPLLNLIGSKTKPDSKCKLGRKHESKCQRSSQEFQHCCQCTVCILLQCVLLNALCFSLAWFVDESVSQEVNKQQQFDSDFISCSKGKYYTFLAVGV